MKLLFVQKSGLPWHGIMSLSAFVKKCGHDTDLVITDVEKLWDRIQSFKPDFVGFPVITGEHGWVEKVSQNIKEIKPSIKIIWGGPHPTFYPQECKLADFITRGEAELPLLDILNGNKYYGYHPTFYPLCQRLNTLPFPDRDIYYKYPHLAKATIKPFITGRGCPFNCKFCSNHLLKRHYKGQKFVRRKSPKYMIEELLDVKTRFGFKTVSFTDDVFVVNRQWLREFLPNFKQEVGVPFICNARFDLINEELLELLKEHGCYGLAMGLESGNEQLREVVLGKKIGNNEAVVNAGRLVKKFGLIIKSYNMIGLPGETLENAFETTELNAKIKPEHASCAFLIPFPRYAIARLYDNPQIPDSIYKPLKGTQKEMINLQTFFFILVRLPWLKPIIKPLLKLPPNPLFRFGALGIYGLFMVKVHRLSVGDIFRNLRHINPFKV